MITVSFFRNIEDLGTKFVERKEFAASLGLEIIEVQAEKHLIDNAYDDFTIDNPWDCWGV